MVKKYSADPEEPQKSAKARGSNLRVHFKNMRETANAIKGMSLKKAKSFLEDVVEHKQAVPFRRFTGGCGRHAQGKLRNAPGSQVGWPVKSCKFILDLLTNAEANAEMRALDVDVLVVDHIQCNRAMKQRRRTYRAHGRINPYMSNPTHIELILSEKVEGVKRGEEDDAAKPVRMSRKGRARQLLRVGGGVTAE